MARRSGICLSAAFYVFWDMSRIVAAYLTIARAARSIVIAAEAPPLEQVVRGTLAVVLDRAPQQEAQADCPRKEIRSGAR